METGLSWNLSVYFGYLTEDHKDLQCTDFSGPTISGLKASLVISYEDTGYTSTVLQYSNTFNLYRVICLLVWQLSVIEQKTDRH